MSGSDLIFFFMSYFVFFSMLRFFTVKIIKSLR